MSKRIGSESEGTAAGGSDTRSSAAAREAADDGTKGGSAAGLFGAVRASALALVGK